MVRRFLWLMTVVAGLGGTVGLGGVVQTRSGQSHAGDVQVRAEGVVVRAAQGGEVRVGWGDLRQVSFADAVSTTMPAVEPVAATAEPAFRIDLTDLAGGLKGEYFGDAEFGRLLFVRTDPVVNFTWTTQTPDPAIKAGAPFSVRWTGQIWPDRTGNYKFFRDDDVSLWIDGQMVYGAEAKVGAVAMKAGEKHDLRLEFSARRGRGTAVLWWAFNAEGRRVVGPARLHLPSDDADPPPTVAFVRPDGGVFARLPAKVTVRAEAFSRAADVAKVELLDDVKVIAPATTAPYDLTWQPGAMGVTEVWARVTDSKGRTGMSTPMRVTVAGDGGGTLAGPWSEYSIGALGRPGTARQEAGVFTLAKPGGDPWAQEDAVHFVMRPLKGDGQVVARITALSCSEGGAAVAGLMLRDSLRAESYRAAVLLQKEAGVGLTARGGRAAGVKFPHTGEVAPCWLKLIRMGDHVRAYKSRDGEKWEFVGADTVALGQVVQAGLAAAAQHNTATCTATFDQVSVTAGVPLETSARGLMLTSGSILAGEVLGADAAAVRLRRAGQTEEAIALKHVARVLYAPVTSEIAPNIKAGTTGAVLKNGDCFEGSLRSIAGQRVEVESVLFGIRSFAAGRDLLAVVLNDVQPAGDWRVILEDGSVLVGRSVEGGDGAVTVDEAVLGRVPAPAAEVREIRWAGQ